VEEELPFFKLLWFLWMEFCGSDGDIGFCINDPFLFFGSESYSDSASNPYYFSLTSSQS
jgi:hypothetical protein